MTVAKIVICIILGILGLVGISVSIGVCESMVGKIVGSVFSLFIAGAMIFGIIWYSYNTEAGKRAYKDQQSNFSGIERVVSIYDINGELIKEYQGNFDVETTENYVLFDDENGQRHMIYYTTGTVIIDEK